MDDAGENDGIAMEYTIDAPSAPDVEKLQRDLKALRLDSIYSENIKEFSSVLHLSISIKNEYYGPWEDKLKEQLKKDLENLSEQNLQESENFVQKAKIIQEDHIERHQQFKKLKLSLSKLLRTVAIGIGTTKYKKEDAKTVQLDKENFDKYVRTIIQEGHGEKLLAFIRCLRIASYRFLSFETFVRLLAILSVDKNLKKEALELIPLVCNKPQRLFYFLHCRKEILSRDLTKSKRDAQNKKNINRFIGWDQPFRRAIAKFYLDKDRSPEDLLRLCTRNKRRYGWSHQKVLGRCHAKVQGAGDVAVRKRKKIKTKYVVKRSEDTLAQTRNLVLCYFTRGIVGVEKQLKKLKTLQEPSNQIYNFIKTLEDIKVLAESADGVGKLVKLIKENRLAIEHIMTKFLKKKEVWEALLHKSLSPYDIIHHLSLMTSKRLFDEDSEDCQENIIYVQKILNDSQKMDNISPLKLLISLKCYEKGSGGKTKLTWLPNRDIQKSLNNATTRSFQNYTENLTTDRNILILVDTRSSMFKKSYSGCHELKSIDCAVVCGYTLWSACKSQEGQCKMYEWPSSNYTGNKETELMKWNQVNIKKNQDTTQLLQLFKEDKSTLKVGTVILDALKRFGDKDTFIVFTNEEPNNCSDIIKELEKHHINRENDETMKKKPLRFFTKTKLVICYVGKRFSFTYDGFKNEPSVLQMLGVDLGGIITFLDDLKMDE